MHITYVNNFLFYINQNLKTNNYIHHIVYCLERVLLVFIT